MSKIYFYDGESGIIEFIAGCMFSEKSGELINRGIKAQQYEKKKVIAYKPSNDNRFSEDKIVSRIGLSIPAIKIPTIINQDIINQIIKETENIDVVLFDEVQFFNEEIIKLILQLAKNKKRVICSGLTSDFQGEPFITSAKLMAVSDVIDQLYAVCSVCGNHAIYNQRLIDNKVCLDGNKVMIGDKELYEPRCRKCFINIA